MTVPSVSLELHRAIVREHDRSASDILATNAALAERVQALEAALDKAADDIAFLRNFFEIQSKQYADKQIAAEADAARLRAVIEEVEFVQSGGPYWSECAWCRKPYPDHSPDCPRQAALAQTAQTSEVKA